MTGAEAIHLEVSIAYVIGLLLSGAFGIWAWVVKKFGEQHIATIQELATEIKEMRKELNKLTERLIVVENRQEFLDRHERR